MAEDDEAVKTADALAAVESPPTEKEQPETKAETAEKPVQTPDEATGEAPEQPEEKPDAKAFQAMRQRIKELESQVGQPQTAEPLVPRFESQPDFTGQQVNQTQFYDPTTGEFDAVGYQNAVRAEAIRAANQITEQRLDEERQTQEAYASYPQLNPNDKNFDQDLYDATSAILLQGMVKGTKITAKQAAEKALGLSSKALKEAADTGAKQTLQEIADKEAASQDVTTSSGRSGSDFSEIERLSEQTRQGGDTGLEAITKRLEQSGF